MGWPAAPSRAWSRFVREIKEFISDGEDRFFSKCFWHDASPSISHLFSRSNLNHLSDVLGQFEFLTVFSFYRSLTLIPADHNLYIDGPLQFLGELWILRQHQIWYFRKTKPNRPTFMFSPSPPLSFLTYVQCVKRLFERVQVQAAS